MNDDGFVGGIILLAALCGCCVGGCAVGRSYQREAAIEAGVAEWQVDPQTGETAFVFRTKGKE